MSLCELVATGLFGWPDVAMGLFCAMLVGGYLGIKIGRELEHIDPSHQQPRRSWLAQKDREK